MEHGAEGFDSMVAASPRDGAAWGFAGIAASPRGGARPLSKLKMNAVPYAQQLDAFDLGSALMAAWLRPRSSQLLESRSI